MNFHFLRKEYLTYLKMFYKITSQNYVKICLKKIMKIYLEILMMM